MKRFYLLLHEKIIVKERTISINLLCCGMDAKVFAEAASSPKTITTAANDANRKPYLFVCVTWLTLTAHVHHQVLNFTNFNLGSYVFEHARKKRRLNQKNDHFIQSGRSTELKTIKMFQNIFHLKNIKKLIL